MSMTYDLWVWEHLTESEQKYLHWNNLERNKKFLFKTKDIGNASFMELLAQKIF